MCNTDPYKESEHSSGVSFVGGFTHIHTQRIKNSFVYLPGCGLLLGRPYTAVWQRRQHEGESDRAESLWKWHEVITYVAICTQQSHNLLCQLHSNRI